MEQRTNILRFQENWRVMSRQTFFFFFWIKLYLLTHKTQHSLQIRNYTISWIHKYICLSSIECNSVISRKHTPIFKYMCVTIKLLLIFFFWNIKSELWFLLLHVASGQNVSVFCFIYFSNYYFFCYNLVSVCVCVCL